MKKIALAMIIVSAQMSSSAQSKMESQQEQQINNLISKMSLEEKVGQMTQISVEAFLKTANGIPTDPHVFDFPKLEHAIQKYKIGSILNVGGNAQTISLWRDRISTIQKLALKERLRIPVLYGVDAIHGNNYTLDAVLFPQQISQAASFNRELTRMAAEATAYETRASFIPWNFSPVLDLGRQPVWPRIWETYGEDPFLISELGCAAIEGYQGSKDVERIDKYHVAACLKHYMGYSMPLSGHDRTPAWIPERELREYFLPQFAQAINAGAKTVMVNSAEINGIPVHINKHILTDILKGELGFKGLVVSDWQDIQYLYQRHRVAKDNKEAVMLAINAGIDMSMVPTDFTFCDALIELVNEGKVSMNRIDDAVKRILKVKYEVGLFEKPIGNPRDYPEFNGKKHNTLNFNLTAECPVLLKNDGILPLKSTSKILVTGPCANTMRSLIGGWGRNWQGLNSDETESSHNTILKAIQQVFGKDQVSYSQGADFEKTINLPDVIEKAKAAEVIILCIGETSYTETPGNIEDLRISSSQIALAKELAQTGKPVIFVLTEGRPRVISSIEPYSNAILHALLPGNEGGNVIAQILSGKINPSGKLPYTYPRNTNSLLPYYHKYTETLKFDEAAGFNPQWEFGFGLNYTSFAYSSLKVSNDTLSDANPVKVSINVSNTGKKEGKETVLLFVSDEFASITPEVKRLRGFEKVNLRPGETKTIEFELTKEQLSFINADLQRVTESGTFTINIGGLTQKIEVE